jgi:hypothetical protein
MRRKGARAAWRHYWYEDRDPALRWVPDLQDDGRDPKTGACGGGLEADIELVAVNSDEEAKRLRFPGSPTIRVDGRDLFPTPEREDWRLVCRVYATPEGMMGSPTVQMLKAALLK